MDTAWGGVFGREEDTLWIEVVVFSAVVVDVILTTAQRAGILNGTAVMNGEIIGREIYISVFMYLKLLFFSSNPSCCLSLIHI